MALNAAQAGVLYKWGAVGMRSKCDSTREVVSKLASSCSPPLHLISEGFMYRVRQSLPWFVHWKPKSSLAGSASSADFEVWGSEAAMKKLEEMEAKRDTVILNEIQELAAFAELVLDEKARLRFADVMTLAIGQVDKVGKMDEKDDGAPPPKRSKISEQELLELFG